MQHNSPRAKNWCFTIFDPLWVHDKEDDSIVYIVYQREISPTTGAEHIQGYIELSRAIQMNPLKKILRNETAHLEPRRATPQQARAYCMKDETRVPNTTYTEAGVFSKDRQGKRTDLHGMAEKIRDGNSLRNIAEENPGTYVQYHRGFKELKQILAPYRDWKSQVFVLWGDSDTGKSKLAFAMCKEEISWTKLDRLGSFWSDYNGEECVWIDDFDPSDRTVSRNEFLNLTDRYPLNINIKGSSASFLAKTIIITSNYDPQTWYSIFTPDPAVMRRLDYIEHLVSGCKEVPPGNTILEVYSKK